MQLQPQLTGITPSRSPSRLDPEALFEEARQRRRQRWLRLALLVTALVAAGAGTYFVHGGGTSRSTAGSQPGALALRSQAKLLMLRIYFRDNASRRQENTVAQTLKTDPDLSGLKYISKAAAFSQLQKNEPNLTRGLAYNPLPDSFIVTLSRSSEAQALRSRLYPLPPGVATVAIGRKP